VAQRDGKRTRWTSAVTHPVPIVLLAAGGVAGALVAWPIALGGAAACLASVAWITRKGAAATPPIDTGVADVKIRSTEIMAVVVRARKAHRNLHDSVQACEPGLRDLFADVGARAGHLLGHVHEIAAKADQLRARLDQAAIGAVSMDAAARERHEHEYVEALREIDRAARSMELWHTQVSAGASADGAEQAAREVSEELERLHRVARELDQAARR
jgi:hypothetical protein